MTPHVLSLLSTFVSTSIPDDYPSSKISKAGERLRKGRVHIVVVGGVEWGRFPCFKKEKPAKQLISLSSYLCTIWLYQGMTDGTVELSIWPCLCMMRVVVHFGPMTVNFFFSPVFLRYD
jgi:hypothetical protein